MVRQKLTLAEMRIKRSKNEYFNCTERWDKGHKCKGRLFLLSANDNYFSEFTEPMEEEESFVDDVEEIRVETTHIGMHALEVQISPETLKLTAVISNCWVFVLMDSGSTYIISYSVGCLNS